MGQNPRDWQPPAGSNHWEHEARGAGYRRRSSQIATLIKWGWVAMFVLVAAAILIGAM